MQNLRPEDALHKSYLNRLLIEIVDRPILAQGLAFKGDTCASMLGYLDRFSVDLDFDIRTNTDVPAIKHELHRVFGYLNLPIVSKFDKILFFQLRYQNDPGKRNLLKISANDPKITSNIYRAQYFAEIDRFINSQTIESMFSNKLVAVTDRYRLHKTIAGRDIYDIHSFFIHGYSYHPPIISDRTGLEPVKYFGELVNFIKKHVTQTQINEDLNSLLPLEKYQQIRKILIPETISLLTHEQQRLSQ